MSVIVAKSTICPSAAQPIQTTHCFPAARSYVTIPTGTQVTIDSIVTTHYYAAKWMVIIVDEFYNTRTFEVFAVNNNGTPSYTIYGVMGYKFNIVVSVNISSGQLGLVITNNTTHSLSVFATRISVPTTLGSSLPTNTVDITTSRNHAPGGTTVAIDFFTDRIVGMKWIVNITDFIGNKSSAEIAYCGTVANVYAISGNGWAYDFSINTIAGVGTELTITNNSIHHIIINVTRIPVVVDDIGVISCNGASSAPAWVSAPFVVPSATTHTLDDQILATNHLTVDWFIVVNQSTTNATGAVEMRTTIETVTSDVPYGKIGSLLDVKFGTTVASNQLLLHTTNNTPLPITVTALRIPVGL